MSLFFFFGFSDLTGNSFWVEGEELTSVVFQNILIQLTDSAYLWELNWIPCKS